MVGDTLISLLRQLRAGYNRRPSKFPQSVLLCGVHDIHDYRIHYGKDKDVITGGSAFNIKAESLRLGNFSKKDIGVLYQEHTKETGQKFSNDIYDWVWELTGGQPWLVNALAYEVCFEMKSGKNRSVIVTKTMIEEAKESLIQRRETHLDQLVDKLQEDRVRRVIAPILAGEKDGGEFKNDDVEYVKDLGLIKEAIGGKLSIANKIYQEVIPRELVINKQRVMTQETVWY